MHFPSMDNSGVTLMHTSILESRLIASGGYDSSTYSSSVLHRKRRLFCRNMFCSCLYQCFTEELCSVLYDSVTPIDQPPYTWYPSTKSLLLHSELQVCIPFSCCKRPMAWFWPSKSNELKSVL